MFQKWARKTRFPDIGRVVPQISDQNSGELIVYSYRLINEISKSEIETLANLHGRRVFDSADFKILLALFCNDFRIDYPDRHLLRAV